MYFVHLVSAVIPPVPVRQWVLSVPKRLRYFLARDGEFLNRTIALAIRHIEQCLRAHTPLAELTARRGAVVFIQRFGSLLNAHPPCTSSSSMDCVMTTPKAACVSCPPSPSIRTPSSPCSSSSTTQGAGLGCFARISRSR
jgi:hypothetical protein